MSQPSGRSRTSCGWSAYPLVLRFPGSLWALLGLAVAVWILVLAGTPQTAFARGNGVNGYADRVAVTDVDASHLACYNCHGSEDGSVTHPDSGPYIPLVRIVSGPSTLAPGATGTYVLRATRGTSSFANYAGLNVTAINTAWTLATRKSTVAGTFTTTGPDSANLPLATTTDTNF